MHLVLVSLGVVFILMPIAFTFLRLADKIGPEDASDAAAVGISLWVVGLIIGGLLLQGAYKIWPGLMH